MKLPSDDAILALHKKYAPSDQAFAIVYSHCQIIADIAEELIKRKQLTVDQQFVHAAALLHDIGYYPLFDDSGYVPKSRIITHGVSGADILRAEGMSDDLCRIAERHTGVGLTRESIIRKNLPLPKRDFVAETPEEWLVMYADKLHTKSITPGDPHDVLGWFNTPKTYQEHVRKFGESNALRFASLVEQYGVPDLETLAMKYQQKLA